MESRIPEFNLRAFPSSLHFDSIGFSAVSISNRSSWPATETISIHLRAIHQVIDLMNYYVQMKY